MERSDFPDLWPSENHGIMTAANKSSMMTATIYQQPDIFGFFSVSVYCVSGASVWS